MNNLKQFCLVALACLTFASGARAQSFASGSNAQYRWRAVHPSRVGDRSFAFTALSCKGETCSAAALVVDHSQAPWSIRIIFFRSVDGGQSWVEQDAGLQLTTTNMQIRDIQQIDSMNAVAVGDSGLFFRTTDGGGTWVRSNFTNRNLFNAHFSDPSTGIAIANLDTNVFTTTDGGKHWSGFIFPEILWPIRGHSYGAGKFRVITYYAGPLYTTFDGFKTVDTSWLYPMADTIHGITDCNFGPGENMVAYGVLSVNRKNNYSELTRSPDGGKNWTEILLSDSAVPYLTVMSSLEENPVFVGGMGRAKILRSDDHGLTWRPDTTIFVNDTGTYALTSNSYVRSVAVTHSGHPVACFSGWLNGSDGMLMRGEFAPMSVEAYERIVYNTYLYPNPATQKVTVTSIDQSRPVHIIDVLGREVLRGELDSRGQATFDVSSLPRGIYAVMLDHFGRLLSVGKVAVVAKE